MRSKVLIASLLASGLQGFTESEACRFIGARLAKTNSDCLENGLCSAIENITSSGTIMAAYFAGRLAPSESVTCSDAVEIASVIVEESKTEVPVNCATAGLIFDAIHILGLLPLMVSYEPLQQRTIEDMHSFQSCLIANPSEVSLAINPYLSRFKTAMSAMWRLSLSSIHSFDTHTGLLAPAFHFWFDIAALIPGIDVPSQEDLHPITLQTMTRANPYRKCHAREVLMHLQPPTEARDALYKAEAIDRLAFTAKQFELGRRVMLLQADIEIVDALLATPLFVSQTTSTMLHFMVAQSLCPVMVPLTDWIGTQSVFIASIAVKFGVTLVHICQHRTTLSERKRVSRTLGRILTRTPKTEYLEFSLDFKEAIPMIADSDRNWISELSPDMMKDSVLSLRDSVFFKVDSNLRPVVTGTETEYKMFIPKMEYDLLEANYSDYSRGLGRVIGLCLRDGDRLGFLKLHPLIVKLLYNPASARNLGLLDMEKSHFFNPPYITVEEVLKTLSYVRDGIMDTLGPAAFVAHTEEEFEALFYDP